MIAIGGGDGLRLMNGINWNEIICWDGSSDGYKVYKEGYPAKIFKNKSNLNKNELNRFFKRTFDLIYRKYMQYRR